MKHFDCQSAFSVCLLKIDSIWWNSCNRFNQRFCWTFEAFEDAKRLKRVNKISTKVLLRKIVIIIWISKELSKDCLSFCREFYAVRRDRNVAVLRVHSRTLQSSRILALLRSFEFQIKIFHEFISHKMNSWIALWLVLFDWSATNDPAFFTAHRRAVKNGNYFQPLSHS